MPKKRRLPDAFLEYLRELGREGGTKAAGAGGRKRWANVSDEERSRKMRALVKKRWAKARKKRTI